MCDVIRDKRFARRVVTPKQADMPFLSSVEPLPNASVVSKLPQNISLLLLSFFSSLACAFAFDKRLVKPFEILAVRKSSIQRRLHCIHYALNGLHL